MKEKRIENIWMFRGFFYRYSKKRILSVSQGMIMIIV